MFIGRSPEEAALAGEEVGHYRRRRHVLGEEKITFGSFEDAHNAARTATARRDLKSALKSYQQAAWAAGILTIHGSVDRGKQMAMHVSLDLLMKDIINTFAK